MQTRRQIWEERAEDLRAQWANGNRELVLREIRATTGAAVFFTGVYFGSAADDKVSREIADALVRS